VTPCGLVDKYQHPEEPAASTFSSTFSWTACKWSKKLNRCDWLTTILQCNTAFWFDSWHPVQHSESDQCSMFCIRKHNGDHSVSALLGRDATSQGEWRPTFWEHHCHKTQGTIHSVTPWHVPVEWRPQFYQCKSLKIRTRKQHHTCLKSCGFEIHRWDFGRPGVPKIEEMRLRGLWVP